MKIFLAFTICVIFLTHLKASAQTLSSERSTVTSGGAAVSGQGISGVAVIGEPFAGISANPGDTSFAGFYRGPRLSYYASPTALDFGAVHRDSSAVRSFTIFNSSVDEAPISLTIGSPSGPYVMTSSGTVSLKSGDSLVVQVTFTPKDSDAKKVIPKNGSDTLSADGLPTTVVNFVGEYNKVSPSTAVGPLASAYPNPSNGSFTLKLESKFGPVSKVELLNLLGKVIGTSPTLPDKSGALEFAFPGLPTGSYFLRISGRNSEILQRIVIKK